MSRQLVEQRREDLRDLAENLLQQAERCCEAGLVEQAQAILEQVWTIAAGTAPEIADRAAWQSAWLRLRAADYAQAAVWLDRVAAPPSTSSQIWPLIKDTVMRLCRDIEGRSKRPAAVVTDGRPAGSSAATVTAVLPRLEVSNLGRFQIVRDGQVLPACAARKAITIFRYLLATPFHAAQKEELMELAWPEAHPREAAHSLHVAVSTLRRYLNPRGGSYVLQEAGRYVINPDAPVEHDTGRFRQLSAQAEQHRRAGALTQAQQAYLAALDCYQGDYYITDDDPPWAMAERERLLASYLTALDHLGRILIAQGQFEPALTCYQRLLERDSYREDAQGQVMRCYAWLGQRAAALQQYERCRAILASDLGLAPMPELQKLHETIANDGEVDQRA